MECKESQQDKNADTPSEPYINTKMSAKMSMQMGSKMSMKMGMKMSTKMINNNENLQYVFFSFVIFYDDITQKVLEIIEF